MTLAQARQAASDARALIAAGRDPVLVRRMERTTTAETQTRTVRWLVEEWLSVEPNRQSWDARTTALVTQQLTDHVIPRLGHMPISNVTPLHLIDVLKTLSAADKLETLRRVRQRLAQVFDMAVNRNLIVHNPAARLAREFSTPDVEHRACVPVEDVPALFAAIAKRQSRVVELALWLTVLTSHTHSQAFALQNLQPVASHSAVFG